MKNKVPILTGVIALLLVLGFKKPSGNHLERSEITRNLIYTGYTKDTVLMPLYTDRSSFLKLLDLAEGNDDHNANKTLFFQFVHLKSGILTLLLYSGRKNHQDYDPNNSVELTPFRNCMPNPPIIDGNKVSLGVLEIENQKLSWRTLVRSAEDINNHFVVFTPTLIPNTHFKINHIQYEIYFIADTSKICDHIVDLKFKGIIVTNPSPPYSGN